MIRIPLFCFSMLCALQLSAAEPINESASHLSMGILVLGIIGACAVLTCVWLKLQLTKVQEQNFGLKEQVSKNADLGEHLIELEEHMKVVYEQGLFGFVLIQGGAVQYVNKIALDILEYSEDTVRSWGEDQLLSVICPEDRERVGNLLLGQGLGHKGITEHYAYRVISKNQTLKWVDQCSRIVSYKGKEAVLAVCLDMTELKQVEEQVSIFKRFAESSGQGLINMDSLGNPIFVNKSFCSTVLATSPKEVLVKNISSFYPPKLKNKLMSNIIPETLREGQWIGELPLLTTTGKLVPTLQTFFKVSDEYGKPKHVAVVISDISDMKMAEEELMFTKNYIKNVFHALQSMLVSINSDYTITQWNEAAEGFAGLKADEAISKNVFEIVPFLTKYKSEIESVIKNRTKVELFKQLLPLGSEMVYLNICCSPLANDYMDGVVIRVDDVTEVEKKDEQIRQMQKMDTVSQLAGGMAHDFNNMLSGMKSSISVIKHLLAQKKPDLKKLGETIDLADSAVNKATDIVGEVLEVSQKSSLVTLPVDLNSTIKHVALICRKTFNAEVNVRLSCYDDPAMVEADPAKLENALLNVCENAQNAMVDMRGEDETVGGELTIGVEIIYADKHFCSVHPEAKEGYYWIVRVTDTGVGLDTKVISKIFDPFFSTNKSGRGAGLGLAMVYNIIQQHDGFIDIYSELGVGSTFNIFLPEIMGGSAGADVDDDQDEQLRGTGRIMIVDDEPIIRLTAKSILEECGYTTLVAENGREAVDLFKVEKGSVDLVILDMAMPVLSGKDTYVALKKIDADQKILMASGFKQDERLAEVIEMGADGFIQKPYSMADLATQVKAILAPSIS